MDVEYSLATWLFSGLVATVSTLLFVMFYRHRFHYMGPNLPPGTFGYPVVGEMLEFLSMSRKGLPEKFIFDRMNKLSTEIFKTSLVGEPVAVFCGASCNKFVFSNESKLVTAWWPASINKLFPLSNYTNSQVGTKKMRDLLPAFMNFESLCRYVPIMDAIARQCFVADWEGRGQVETFLLAKHYTFRLAAKLLVGLDDPAMIRKLEDSFHLMSAGVFSIPINLPGTPFRRAIKASEFVRGELIKIIKKKRTEQAVGVTTSEDILSHMLIAETSMMEPDIASYIMGVLVAGHDTTSATCTFVLKYLAELPHIYDLVYKEQMEILKTKKEGELLNLGDLQKMKYSWNVAQEVMRLVPPLQGAFREAMTDFVFKGFSIPKGWKLYWTADSTHKNAAYFPDPYAFDPSRFEGNGPPPYTYVPFGGGPHICPGKEYARLKILVFIHNVVKRFRWEKVFLEEGTTVTTIPKPTKGLPVRLFPHSPIA